MLTVLKAFRSNVLVLQARHMFSTQRENYDTSNNQTHFGFETVLESEKEKKVYKVFKNVAEKYDVMNDSMSLGIHRLWKDYFMDRLAPTNGTHLLDVAGGTGDIAFRFLKYLNYGHTSASSTQLSKSPSEFDIEVPKEIQAEFYGISDSQTDIISTGNEHHSENRHVHQNLDGINFKHSTSHVTVCDINRSMLDVGKKRAEDLGYKSGVTWVQGNAEFLPVADNSFDAYTIAYGIRNCTHIDKVLTEAHRVLKPGGRFMCLEFSQVTNPLLSRIYDEYSFQVIPVMGKVIAGDWDSYQYLVESIRKFPDQKRFATMVQDAGFRAVTYENLMFGVSAIHSGFKL